MHLLPAWFVELNYCNWLWIGISEFGWVLTHKTMGGSKGYWEHDVHAEGAGEGHTFLPVLCTSWGVRVPRPSELLEMFQGPSYILGGSCVLLVFEGCYLPLQILICIHAQFFKHNCKNLNVQSSVLLFLGGLAILLYVGQQTMAMLVFFFFFFTDFFWHWPLKKSFYWIRNNIASVLCFIFSWPWGMWDLSSLPRYRTHTPWLYYSVK